MAATDPSSRPSPFSPSFGQSAADVGLSAISDLERLVDLAGSQQASAPRCDRFLADPAKIECEAERLRDQQLSPQISRWAQRYAKVGERNDYLWTWCRRGIELTTLPSVSAELRDEVGDAKLLGVMYDVLIDDVADQGGDPGYLELLLRRTLDGVDVSPDAVVNGAVSDSQRHYVEFTEQVWREVRQRVEQFPRYRQLAALLEYDYRQLANAMRYSLLLNRFPSLLNMVEHDLYLPHNMHMMVSATMDLMCSPDFDFDEIGLIREAIWHAQYMGRIGNLVTTWEREIQERDFTSGVFAHAVIEGDLTPPLLRTAEASSLADAIRQGRHEAYFLDRWQLHRANLFRIAGCVQTVDLMSLVDGLERLLCLHLASRGRK